MINKIIAVNLECCQEVLLTIYRDEEGYDCVEITAWHFPSDGDQWFQRDTVKFPTFSGCRRFIADYSLESAREFADSFSF